MNQSVKDRYLPPEAKELSVGSKALLCISPGAGGSEDIGYDNWGNLLPGGGGGI